MASNHLWIVTSIVAASAALIIATRLLAPAQTPVAGAIAGAVTEVTAGTSGAPVVAPGAPASAAPRRLTRSTNSESRRLGLLHAGTALAALRGTFIEKCWNPSVARSPSPEQIDLRFNLAFDPAGSLVGVGISDNRKAFRTDVSACLRGLSVKFNIPAPGAPLQVQVPFTLP